MCIDSVDAKYRVESWGKVNVCIKILMTMMVPGK